MDIRKLRSYPPLIVCLLVLAALIFSMLLYAASGQAASEEITPPEAAPPPTPVEIEQVVCLLQEVSQCGTSPTSPAETTQTPAEPQEVETVSMVWSRDFSGEDCELLMKIAMAEAEGESTEGKALVMMVVLNRVWSDAFPGTIEEVILQESGGTYQFSPARPGGRLYTLEPNEDCAAALDLVMNGWDESHGALYFEAAGRKDSWHSRNLEFLFQEGHHKFYR